MSDPESSTRDRLIDAFESLLVSGGSRAATLDAVAAEAEVSKGGLLYHFHNKEELVDGMLERLKVQGDRDIGRMKTAKKGPVEYYLTTSVDDGSDFDRALIAVSRIAQEQEDRAISAMADLREDWFEVLRDHLEDDSLARTIQLIGDGLYFADTMDLAEKNALKHVRVILRRLGAIT